ncbi:MAG: outer membrane protein assembly factor BamD [Bacteroidetes bacterium]|nr:MAG: outer membrane protein assembly factor BamD [Bacteroidota bacterium]
MIRSYIIFLVFVSILFGCSSSDVTQNMPAEERFAIGKKLFEEEEYLDAKKEFEIVKLQYPGSSVADDAQYYLAECYYMREEYLLASEEYKSLRRNLPGSTYLSLAQYKIAMCYYNLSPESHLDQQYTLKAIDMFQSFIEYYPTDDLVADASSKIKELNGRLAQKDFDSAELYMKLGYYRSAAYYYNGIVEKFHDTPFAEPAHVGLAKAQTARKKYEEAKAAIEKFLQKYPHSKQLPEIESLKKEIEEKLQSRSGSGSPEQHSQTIK